MSRTKQLLTKGAALGFVSLAAPLMAFAQTTTDATTTPGVPNTGMGGDAVASLALLAVSAATAIAGAVYLSRRGALAH